MAYCDSDHSESLLTEDSDVTPELDFPTTSNCDNEYSKNSVKIKKTFWDSDESDYTSEDIPKEIQSGSLVLA